MDRHALALLEAADSWDWPGDQGRKLKAIMPKLLSGFIAESQQLGGTLLDRFWVVLGQCHPRLEENIKVLRHTEFSSGSDSEAVLFEGVERAKIIWKPILEFSGEVFTHLCIAFMNPSSPNPGSNTPLSVNGLLVKDTDELMQMAASEGSRTSKQAAQKALVCKRDGHSCPLTGAPFTTADPNGINPFLAHIIPDSVHDKPDTIKCIAMFAGTAVRDLVVKELNGPGNIMNIQSDAHSAYDRSHWGIEAREEHPGMVKYIYRRLPYSPGKGPAFIRLCDGDQIIFGRGPEAAQLGLGPNPTLCNLRLAMARVIRMSGAAEVIAQIIEDGDDSDFPHIYVAAPMYCDMLIAQLQLAGGVLV